MSDFSNKNYARLVGTGAGSKRRGLTSAAWKGIDIASAMVNPAYGVVKKYDFGLFNDDTDGATGHDFTITQATAGTVGSIAPPLAGFPRLLEIDSNHTTVGNGINMQDLGFPVYPESGMVVVFDGKFRVHDHATSVQLWLGWADADTTILSSAVPAITNGLGVYSNASLANALKLYTKNGSTADTSSSNLTTPGFSTILDADTTTDGTEWVDLAIRWEVNKKIQVFINHLEAGQDNDIATDPAAVVYPSLVCQVGTTNEDAIKRMSDLTVGYAYL